MLKTRKILPHLLVLVLERRFYVSLWVICPIDILIFDLPLGMAFLFNNASISSHFRSSSSKNLSLSRREFHVEPGTREKALLAEDAALKRFKSHRKSVHKLKRIGDVLTVVVVAGCCYEMYVRAMMRKEAKAAGKS